MVKRAESREKMEKIIKNKKKSKEICKKSEKFLI
jgi:hypothetical protein